jgi:hypothetical protein
VGLSRIHEVSASSALRRSLENVIL